MSLEEQLAKIRAAGAKRIPEEVRANPDDWTEIGEEHHDELDVIKAEMFWRRTVRKKFVQKSDKARPPLIAPAPLPGLPSESWKPREAKSR